MTTEITKKYFEDLDPEVVKKAIEEAQAKNRDRIASIDLKKHLREALDYLDRNFAFFLTDVLNMGYPEYTLSVPTAAVAIPSVKDAKYIPSSQELKGFRFLLNPTFAALLEPKELAFILSHETMHILLNHLRVGPKMISLGAEKERTNISMDCYDDQTEVLSENGWVLFKDLLPGEKVATRTPDGTLEYQTPIAYVDKPYRGKLICYESKRINFAVTPNHNLLLHQQNDKLVGYKMKRVPRLVKACEATEYAYWVPRSSLYGEGNTEPGEWDPSSVVIPTPYHPQKVPPILPTVSRRHFAEFIGFWLGDGHKIKPTHGYAVKISQTKPAGVIYLNGLFKRLGWPVKRTVRPTGEMEWAVMSPHLKQYCLGLQDGAEDLRLPPDILEWTQDEQNGLLEGLIAADGTWSNQAKRHTAITNTSKKLLDDLQRLIVHMGWSGNIRQISSGGDAIVNGVRCKTKIAYKLHLDLRPFARLDPTKIFEREYDGRVYCVMVPNSTLMVRRHGVMMWCGNCVINNFLRDRGLEVSERLEKMIFFGEKWCGYNTALGIVREVYKDIDDQKLKERQEANDALSEYLDQLGLPATGGHGWIYEQEAAQGNADAIGDDSRMPKSIQNSKDDEDNKRKQYASAGVGTEAEKEKRWVENNDVSLRWAKLLSIINPDMFRLHGPGPRASFHRSPRKLTYVMEREKHMGVIPVMEPARPKSGDQPAIAMYVDGSGSCCDYIDKFVRLCISVPEEKIKLFAFSFSTYVLPLDLKNPSVADGGTEFSIIENSIKNDVVPKLGHYPKAVVVMTDGIGYFSSTRPEKDHEDNWLWLIKGGRPINPRCGKDVNIDDFTEGMF